MPEDLANELFPQQCGCADCEAAVSPAAYLSALLDYALKHIRNDKKKIDLQFLVDTFHQPFIALPTDCEAVEKQLHQVRICIEVLRSYLGNRPLADPVKEAALVKGEADYRFAVYAMLLNRIGTSYEEIRRVRSETDENRKALAERLGIDLTVPRPDDLPNDDEQNGDELDQLFLDPSATPPQDHLLTERVIEKLFGLVNTTRDPLSEGAKLGDDQAQITRWNLNGIVWGQNTDTEGMIHVALVNPAPTVFRVELYQELLRTKLMAAGEIATATGAVKLVPESNSRLSGVFEIAYTADSTVISIAAIPGFLSWQLKHLRTLWSRQDHPIDAYSDNASPQVPIIDPDLLGPDDFRNPNPKINLADPNRAFDIWLNRRTFIDITLNDLKVARETNGLTAILKQVLGNALLPGNPLPDLDGLLLVLTKGGTADEIKTAKDSITALALTVESFTRLMSIRAKDQLAQSDTRNDKVSEQEWREIYSILTQALKAKQFDAWRTEEQGAGIRIGLEEFWFSLTEPKEGDWPVIPIADQPLIDPGIVKLTDLPDWLSGKEAISLWNARKTQIEQIPKDLKAERETNGFDAMLRLALGNPLPGNALQHDLNTLKNSLSNADETTRNNAIEQIETDLHLTVENFKRLMGIKEANDQPDPAKKPTAAEFAEVYAILTLARKLKHEYPQWVQQEKSAGLVYWKALKAKLPHWQASLESRQGWQQALRIRSQPPIIDPTVMGADDLLHVIPGDPAFDVWKERYDQLAVLRDGLKTTREADAPDTLAGLDHILKEALDFEPADLEALDQERQAGLSVEKRLEQLNLINSAFNYLMRIRGLAKAKQPITDFEWVIVYDTLAQSKIQREFAEMRAQEQDRRIILSPDFFKIPETLLTPLPFLEPSTPRWLSTWQARRDWQDALQSRIDQVNSTIEGSASAIGAVEEATLPVLRDALIEASDAVGANFSEEAEWITARLLIDARSGGCQMTTRVAQALETLQTLSFDLRSGQFKQLAASPLSLVSDYFDEEWKWIGSYATWRSAMFVFLYPENILQPSLLKVNDRTPFETLIKNTRGIRLNPQQACSEAETYANYFRDICSLEIEATCQASTIVYTGEGCDRQPSTAPSMFYMFGRAQSGKIYWSAYDAGGNSSGYGQTFWEEVKGLGDIKVVRIVGAMPYRKSYITGGGGSTKIDREIIKRVVQSSYIHVFCITGEMGKQALQLVRLNLDNFGEWDTTVHPLALPPLPFVSTLEIIPVQTQGEFIKPGLVFHSLKSSKFYFRTLNGDGTDWEPDTPDWNASLNTFEPYLLSPYDFNSGLNEIKAVLSVNSDVWVVRSDLTDFVYAEVFTLNGGGKEVGSVGGIYIGGSMLGVLPGQEFDGLARVVAGSDIYVFLKERYSSATKYLHLTFPVGNHPFQEALTDLVRIPPTSGSGDTGQQILAYQREKNANAFYMYKYAESGDSLVGSATIRAVPRVEAPLSVPLHLSATNLQQRRQDIIKAFALNADATASVLQYLREAYYFVPLHLALGLQSAGHYLASLDCFRTVYDYEAQRGSPNQRNIYYGLELDATLPDVPLYQQADGWLLDPLNPHSIAATRHFTYTRFTIMSLVRCLLDFADSEFTQETGESLAQARTLYLTALDLLNLPELQQKLGKCDDLIAELKIEPGKDIPPEVPAAVGEILENLTMVSLGKSLGKVSEAAKAALQGASAWNVKLTDARAIVNAAVAAAPSSPTTGAIVTSKANSLREQHALLLMQPLIDDRSQIVGKTVVKNMFADVFAGIRLIDPVIPPSKGKIPEAPLQPLVFPLVTLSLKFCIPPNPILRALRLHAELNLYKLRTCRNIAGLKRQLDAYAAPTDTTTGLPAIGAGGQLTLPGIATLQPSLYRYPVLIERAKQLVQLAAQIEGAMLSALEKRDVETQTLLQARQQLSLAQAGVQLQDLQVGEANDGVTLSDLQKERAQIQIDTYEDWLQTGANEYERQMIEAYGTAAAAQKGATEESFRIQEKQAAIAAAQLANAIGGYLGAAVGIGDLAIDTYLFANQSTNTKNAIDATAAAQIASVNAALERRKDEWQLQKQLAEQDSLIGDQQKKIATDQVQIATQERAIAGIGADNAKDTVEFLTNKFTNVELFDWMSNILEGVYSFFLQQATAMAKLAANQLAFERQEVPPAFINSDYWNVPSESSTLGNTADKTTDRRGLTGSARLLQDIYQLDQYAFATNKRKLSLTKTISLARLAPFEFQRFCETGVMQFATPMELFDRDFPGHYLRLIKRVRTSVIALIPPIEGIHATLSTTGPSRVVIGGDVFQTVPIRRDPEFIALSAPSTSTGVSELDPQPDMLLPFEGSGVEMSWEFNMPKAANRFDYRTIADVLITLEYTALYSFDYRQQVIQSLKPTISTDRPFSFRNQFADQWYDLNNSDQTKTPMKVKFQTFREDFPPNVEALKIQQVLLYFVRTNQKTFELPITTLRFTEQSNQGTVGGSATPIDGKISTRSGNAGSWTVMIGKAPVGEWELTLPNTEEIKKHFLDEEIDDILFVITYAGRTPEWP